MIPSQSALSQSVTNNENFNLNTLVEGVVVNIRYPNNPNPQKLSRSTFEIEYDVDVTSIFGMGRLYNLPRIDVVAGIDDGDENILRAADTTTNQTPFVLDGGQFTVPNPRYKTTGDRVLVGFINGNAHRAVIIGVLTHPAVRRAWRDAAGQPLPTNGERIRRALHGGTETLFDANGNITVNFGASLNRDGVATNANKVFKLILGDFTVTIDNTTAPTKVTFATSGGKVLEFTSSDFVVGHGGAVNIKLGDTASAQAFLLGTIFRQKQLALHNSLQAQLSTLSGTIGLAGAALTLASPALTLPMLTAPTTAAVAGTQVGIAGAQLTSAVAAINALSTAILNFEAAATAATNFLSNIVKGSP